MDTKLCPGTFRTAETCSLSLLEHHQSVNQHLFQDSTFSASWKERCLGTKHRNKLSQTLEPALEVLQMVNFQPQDPDGKNTFITESVSRPGSKGFPFQKFKIMKWIQD